MKKLILIAAMLAATPVFAQTLTPNSELTFTLTPGEADTIGKGLGKLPYEESAGVIQKMQRQYAEQQKKAADAVAAKPVDKDKK